MKNYKLHFVFLWIAIIILALLLCIRVEPFIVWSSETYIGIFITLMGIAVAVIIGYQAITANEIRNELRLQKEENDKLRKEVDSFKINITKQITEFRSNTNMRIETISKDLDIKIQSLQTDISELEVHANSILVSSQESVSILNSLNVEKEQGNLSWSYHAFLSMLQALYYGLQYNSQNIQFIMNKLREYGSNIHTNTFGAGFSMSKGVLYYCTPPFSGRPLKEVVDEQYLPPINNIDNDIRNLENFSSIVHDYNSLMKQLHERIDICTTRNFPSGINELEETFN